jgi:hypothetical protein
MAHKPASEVWFFDFGESRDVLEGIDLLLDKVLGRAIQPGGRVAIKIHFGERGNFTHIRPAFVRRVVDRVKEEGGLPFVVETTTLYPKGHRLTVRESLETAKYNGFSEEGLGCPLVIADEPDGQNGLAFKVDWVKEDWGIREVKVARHLAEADSVIVFSHVKGHLLSGMGGALKNLGMGCTTRASKRDQHRAHGLLFDYEKCTACGKCIEVCTFNALTMQDGRPLRDEENCMYCNTCYLNCENDAIDLFKDGKERFQMALAHAAAGVMRAFMGKRTIFLNSLTDVTQFCDCAAPAGGLVTPNVGILGSTDPVAIDKASLDLLDQAPIIPGWRVAPPDILGKINGTSSLIHLEEAERLGLGSIRYSLVKL